MIKCSMFSMLDPQRGQSSFGLSMNIQLGQTISGIQSFCSGQGPQRNRRFQEAGVEGKTDPAFVVPGGQSRSENLNDKGHVNNA